MKRNAISALIISGTILFLASTVFAHSPFNAGDNESLETASVIPDPTKSWAIYAELHEGGEAQYYRFDALNGQRMHVMLFKSTRSEDDSFLPTFVLMGPGIQNQGSVPSFVEIPDGAGTAVVDGIQSSYSTFEPFSPSVFYELAQLDLAAPADGTYYVAVYESSRGGHYGLAVGDREDCTLTEFILIPISLVSVYQWEGQSLALVFAPMTATVAIGLALVVWRWRTRLSNKGFFGWIGVFAGLLFLGSGASVLFQLTFKLTQTAVSFEIVVTVVFALLPIILGAVALLLCSRAEEKVNLRKRIYLAIVGIAALFAWAGLLIGPALALIASFSPSRIKSSL